MRVSADNQPRADRTALIARACGTITARLVPLLEPPIGKMKGRRALREGLVPLLQCQESWQVVASRSLLAGMRRDGLIRADGRRALLDVERACVPRNLWLWIGGDAVGPSALVSTASTREFVEGGALRGLWDPTVVLNPQAYLGKTAMRCVASTRSENPASVVIAVGARSLTVHFFANGDQMLVLARACIEQGQATPRYALGMSGPVAPLEEDLKYARPVFRR